MPRIRETCLDRSPPGYPDRALPHDASGPLPGLLRGEGLRAVRRLGDLNPGRARTLTALAARVAAVPIGSSWTNPVDGRPWTALHGGELQPKLQPRLRPELRITRVFPYVARGFKASVSFMFASCCRNQPLRSCVWSDVRGFAATFAAAGLAA